MPIKNIIFDMGDVLVKINPSLTPDAFFALGADRNVIDTVFNDKEIFIQYHKGELSSEKFRTDLKQKLNLSDITDDQFDQAWLASITELRKPSKDFIDRLAFIEKLKLQGYKTFLLSNNNEIHHANTIKWYGDLLNKSIPVETQYYSHHLGWVKPQPEIFKYILSKNNLEPSETVFFDDIPEYIKAAENLGIHAMQYTREESMERITDKIKSINQQDAKETENVKLSTSSSLLQFSTFSKPIKAMEMQGFGSKLHLGPIPLFSLDNLDNKPRYSEVRANNFYRR